MQKFAAHQNLVNLVARLQAKCTAIEKALVRCSGGEMRSVAFKDYVYFCTGKIRIKMIKYAFLYEKIFNHDMLFIRPVCLHKCDTDNGSFYSI